MAQLEEIAALVRSINSDEFQEPLTQTDSLDDIHRELKFLAARLDERKRRTREIIDHITDCFAGNFFNQLPISADEDELDVISMGFNTYIEELRATMVSKEELEKTNKQLRREKDRSEQLAAAKDEFMSNMSHEIRTPLNGILGFTNNLIANKILPAEYQKQLEFVKISGDILLVIINDILDLAKIDAGKMTLEESPIKLRELTQLIFSTFSETIRNKELQFHLKVEEAVPATLLGDSVRLSQVLFNFVSNAVKFTSAGGTIHLTIRLIKQEADRSWIELVVKDNGIGIPADKLETVFTPFVQTSNDTARKYGGTGLGLTIVKKITDLMHGEVTVESELGKGTTFSALIPLKNDVSAVLSESQPTATIQYAAANGAFASKDVRVLLAEDNAINQLLVQTVLARYQMQVTTVGNGKLAVEAVENGNYDVVLMDLMMPEMDGYEATTVIRRLPDPVKNTIPIIALTAVVTNSVTDKCREMGMDSYISKPFDANELFRMIMELTAR